MWMIKSQKNTFFKWEKIHAYMLLSNWTWADVEGVPDVHDLQVKVSSLMEKVRNSSLENTSMCGGGFFVNKWKLT